MTRQLTGYHEVRAALRDLPTDVYVEQLEPILGRSLLSMSGEAHRSLRALIAPSITGPVLGFRNRVEPIARRHAADLIRGFRNTGHVELVSAFTSLFSLRVVTEVLGLPARDLPLFKLWGSALMSAVIDLGGAEDVRAAGQAARDDLRAYLAADEETTSSVALMLMAANHNNPNALASLVMHLVDHPGERDLARAFAETLRLETPFPIVLRNDAAGEIIVLRLDLANRDPSVYDRPDAFIPDRAGPPHLAFAAGAHTCVGLQIAKLEVEIGAAMLLEAMPDVRWQPGFRPEIAGVYLRGPRELRLEFTADGSRGSTS